MNSNSSTSARSSAAEQVAAITARLDRLPATRSIWMLVILLSIGGCFEIYDLFVVGYVSPGLIRAGIFHNGAQGLFGFSDQATFASVTFIGLFIGTMAFGFVADRFGRRIIFMLSLLWYAVADIFLSMQHAAIGIDVFRFIAGVGIGVELVTIDSYISELVPKSIRGRAFAINQCIQFIAVPIVAFLSWRLIPMAPLGIAGWRFVVLFPALGAIFVWFIQRRVPESPRWLAGRGYVEDADRVTSRLEAQVSADIGGELPPPGALVIDTSKASFSEIWHPPFRKRTIMMSVFNFFQSIGFYGFASWVPALVAARGNTVTKSLEYSFFIAALYPVAPLLFSLFADKFERKWQIVVAAIGIGVFGIIFAVQSSPAMLVLFGAGITLSIILMSYSYHAYQAELFPTRVRARAVGFVYSFSRISAAISAFMIAFFLQNFGDIGVFAFIAASMVVVVISIGVFGPRTRGLALEEISH